MDILSPWSKKPEMAHHPARKERLLPPHACRAIRRRCFGEMLLFLIVRNRYYRMVRGKRNTREYGIL
jgi:hypothetical protein